MDTNWLLYIGGYAVFSSLVNILHGIEWKALHGTYKFSEAKPNYIKHLPDSVCTILIWVWVCKNFF